MFFFLFFQKRFYFKPNSSCTCSLSRALSPLPNESTTEQFILLSTPIHTLHTDGVKDTKIYAGTPSYIMQEEFSRYVGHWWGHTTEDAHTILYEEVDERHIAEVDLSDYRYPGGSESFIFPRAGDDNAKVTLKVAIIPKSICMNADAEDGSSPAPAAIAIMCMTRELKESFPWMEYIVRCGAVPNSRWVSFFFLSLFLLDCRLPFYNIRVFYDTCSTDDILSLKSSTKYN